jgi:threonine/homoserine/homoserine lactone efflux protein
MIDFLPGFLAAYAILFFAASSPGPAVAMLLGIATNQGRAAALVASAGIAAGSVVINIATLLGVGYLLSEAAWAVTYLRLIGAAYLLWLAYGAFRKAVHPPEVQPAGIARRSATRHFLAGFLLQVTNPKAIFFWLAIASIGATKGGDAGIVLLFVTGAFVISFGCHGAWALLLSSSPIRALYAHARRGVECVLGTFFAVAAFKLASARTS